MVLRTSPVTVDPGDQFHSSGGGNLMVGWMMCTEWAASALLAPPSWIDSACQKTSVRGEIDCLARFTPSFGRRTLITDWERPLKGPALRTGATTLTRRPPNSIVRFRNCGLLGGGGSLQWADRPTAAISESVRDFQASSCRRDRHLSR